MRMLCRRCEARPAQVGWRRLPSWPARVWGQHGLGDLLCAACGTILAGEDVAERLLRKQSQLAQFGLVGVARPLLKAARPEDQ